MKTQYTIGKYLRDTGKSLSQLAKDAGLNHSVLSRIMSGSTKNLTVDTAERIAYATDYKMSVYEILGLQPMYIIREVAVHQSKEKGDDSSPNIVAAPASKDCTTHTPSFGITYGNTSLSRIPNTAQSCPPKSDKTCLDRIFDFWVRVFAKSRTRTKLTLKRKKAIQTALDDFSVEQLIDSIQGHANDPWRQSRPVRHELSTLLRPGNIERGLDAKDEFASPDQEEDATFWEDEIASEGGGA